MDVGGVAAIVTGAASGLGDATVRALVARGARVVLVDVDEEAGRALATEVHGTFVRADVAEAGDVAAAVAVAAELGSLRILVNCAGIVRGARTVSGRGEPFPLDAADLVLRVNLTGTFNCVRLVAAAMAAAPPTPGGARGVIVNTASTSASEGQVGQSIYAASKAAVASMTLPLARELADHGIRVNTIAPGLFDTPILGDASDRLRHRDRLEAHLVFPRRAGEPAEFAALVLAIVEDDYINGEVIRIDGATRMPPR